MGNDEQVAALKAKIHAAKEARAQFIAQVLVVVVARVDMGMASASLTIGKDR